MTHVDYKNEQIEALTNKDVGSKMSRLTKV